MHKKGFTLLELLIVVAIIGVLAGLILASLSSSRGKARDTAIRQSVTEMKKLLELEFLNSGSYTNLFSAVTWLPFYGTCGTQFSGTYATNVRSICNDIIRNSEANLWGDVRLNINSGPVANSYSIEAWLPSKQVYLCVGSNGQTSETTTQSQAQGGFTNMAPGCHTQNPW